MRCSILLLVSLFLSLIRAAEAAPYGVECRQGPGDYVVLVHGLDWFRDTLEPTAEFLNHQGYSTINVRYPSRKVADPQEAALWVAEMVREHCQDPAKHIHLVAHSMGALVVREYLAAGKPPRLGRVVLLAAPNHGTPLAEPLKWKPLAKFIAPAVAASCLPRAGDPALPDSADYAPGILMGNRPGWFPFLSPFIKGPDDGVVPVASGRLAGMSDFRVLTTSHTSMPHNKSALREVLTFLQTGRFL
jgi:pimeloyl-ACP methyl ester carboxylesterase